ncbi:MAG: Yip1 family protein [Proteobacteria bacterium]|nr:Yip1 family protein [Pseudomonadota bacterium]
MKTALQRAVRLTFHPELEWQAIRSEAPDQGALLASFVLPMVCIPALSCGLGLAFHEGFSKTGLEQAAHRGSVTFFGSLLSIFLLGMSLYVLAPLFVAVRDWARAFQVAAYSSAPVLLGGVILVVPDIAYVMLLPALQSLYLQYVGVHRVMGVKEGEAAEYVALGIVLLVIASTLAGAFGAWLGIL